MRQTVRTWLQEGRVDIVLGFRNLHGHVLPFAFSIDNLDDVEHLVVSGPRYPLEKLALELIAARPAIRVGIAGDHASLRAVNVFLAWNQTSKESIMVLPVDQSPQGLAECSPDTPKFMGIVADTDLGSFEEMEPRQRFTGWMLEFQKCMKCYGCRNICPVCFCKECSLENQELIGAGTVLTEVPIFHLVRAVHMAGRCVDCGLCEAACPVGIPLRLLYRKVNAIVRDLFGYDTGSSAEQPPLSVLGEEVPMEPRPLE